MLRKMKKTGGGKGADKHLVPLKSECEVSPGLSGGMPEKNHHKRRSTKSFPGVLRYGLVVRTYINFAIADDSK